jgi:FkbM family methyltransferase
MTEDISLFPFYKPVDSCQIPGLQAILAGVFGVKKDGTFVEVGAMDGIAYSNTYQLAELGWEGLCIEPVPHLFQKLVANHINHPKMTLVNMFVSSKAGEIDMFEHDEMFTGDPEWLRKIDNFARKPKVATVKTETLDVILNKAGIVPEFDLLVIDVEGHEMSVLSGFSIAYWHPKLVIVESCAYAENEMLHMHADAIHHYFNDNWYERIWADKINSIYILNLW